MDQDLNHRTKSSVSLREAFPVWSKIALLSFGGPAGQIAVMHSALVEEKKWVSESRFLHALNYCMLLPGPEAQQLAIYIGWLMHRWVGGLIAGILFVLPGFISILILSIIYGLYQEVAFVSALFFGLKPAVVSIVIAAVLKIGSKALKTPLLAAIASLSFIALFFFDTPFPLVIFVTAALGFFGGKRSPKQFEVPNPHKEEARGSDHEDLVARHEQNRVPTFKRSLIVLLVFGGAWWIPVLALFLFLGRDHIFTQEGLFFSKASLLTFGGAYAVLAYIAQQAVENYKWLNPTEMLDGLGMAETTPGPLIQVVQFVGFMGAFRAAEASAIGLSPISAGVIASIITIWVTFVPCFLWIFLGAPYIEQLRNNKDLSHALSAITAAVVGVILNLSIWFALHVVFKTINETTWGMLHLHMPELASIDLKTLSMALFAAVLTFGFKLSMMKVIAISILIGFCVYFI